MASRVCYSCGVNTHMTIVLGSGSVVQRDLDNGRQAFVTQAAFMCDECGLMSLGIHIGGQQPYEVESFMANNVQRWVPPKASSTAFPDVPDHIAEAATEATLCMSSGAYRAVGSLARAVIEATAKERGVLTGNLASKIDELAKTSHIRPHTRDQAHEIRHFGNDMAHGDFTDPVSKEEAEEVVQLMSEVLDEVYQSPARLARVRAARISKSAKTPTPER